jgi:hypothetical protein
MASIEEAVRKVITFLLDLIGKLVAPIRDRWAEHRSDQRAALQELTEVMDLIDEVEHGNMHDPQMLAAMRRIMGKLPRLGEQIDERRVRDAVQALRDLYTRESDVPTYAELDAAVTAIREAIGSARKRL